MVSHHVPNGIEVVSVKNSSEIVQWIERQSNIIVFSSTISLGPVRNPEETRTNREAKKRTKFEESAKLTIDI